MHDILVKALQKDLLFR